MGVVVLVNSALYFSVDAKGIRTTSLNKKQPLSRVSCHLFELQIPIRAGSCDSQATKMFTHIVGAAVVLLLVESAYAIVRANNIVREILYANKTLSNNTNKV